MLARKTIFYISRIGKFILLFVLIFNWIFSGWPQIFGFPPGIQISQAAVPTVWPVPRFLDTLSTR